MVRLFLTGLLFIGINFIIHAQITLTVDDLPKAGDIQVSARIDSLQDLTLLPGNSGANITWDFSTLGYYVSNLDNSFDSTSYIYKSQTPDSISFPLADIAQTTNCYLNHNWQTHVITLICYYNYLFKDPEGLHLYGSSYPQTHLYLQYRNIFPILQYGDTSVSYTKEILPAGVDSVFTRTVADISIADGWGTVITPVSSYNALRIFTSETVYDSLYINGIGQETSRQTGNYYYKWYTKDMGFPVFQISKGILEKQSGYQITHFAKYLRRNVGIKDNYITNQNVSVNPNPFSDNARISLGNNVTGKYSIRVFNINSIECLRIDNVQNNEYTINKGNLEKGMYFFQVTDEKGNIHKGKFIIN